MKDEREERGLNERGRGKEAEKFALVISSDRGSSLNTLWVYLAAKPIHHQEDQCLRLKVIVSGKISECQSPVGLLPAPLC